MKRIFFVILFLASFLCLCRQAAHATERYRAAGEMLIINQDDCVINARFMINSDQMAANFDKYSIVLKRVEI